MAPVAVFTVSFLRMLRPSSSVCGRCPGVRWYSTSPPVWLLELHVSYISRLFVTACYLVTSFGGIPHQSCSVIVRYQKVSFNRLIHFRISAFWHWCLCWVLLHRFQGSCSTRTTAASGTTAISGIVVILVPGVGGVQHLFRLWYAGWQLDSIVPLVPSQFRQVSGSHPPAFYNLGGKDTHVQFLVTYIIEELSQGRKDLSFVLDRVLHLDHGGTSLGQISRHLFRVIFLTSRLRSIPIGLRKGQPKEAMADDITVDPMCLLLIKVIKEPLVGIKGQLPERLSQRAPGVFSVWYTLVQKLLTPSWRESMKEYSQSTMPTNLKVNA